MLTAQLQALAAAIRASSDPTVVAALAVRNDTALTAWCNANSTTDAWNEAMTKRSFFEAMDVAKYDNLTAGKRDAYAVMMENAPVDMTRNKMRKAIEDIWGATDSVAVLQACTRKATNGELILGGTDATTNTVTAKKLDFPGNIGLNDVSDALNKY